MTSTPHAPTFLGALAPQTRNLERWNTARAECTHLHSRPCLQGAWCNARIPPNLRPPPSPPAQWRRGSSWQPTTGQPREPPKASLSWCTAKVGAPGACFAPEIPKGSGKPRGGQPLSPAETATPPEPPHHVLTPSFPPALLPLFPIQPPGSYLTFEYARSVAAGRPKRYEGSWIHAMNEAGYSVAGAVARRGAARRGAALSERLGAPLRSVWRRRPGLARDRTARGLAPASSTPALRPTTADAPLPRAPARPQASTTGAPAAARARLGWWTPSTASWTTCARLPGGCAPPARPAASGGASPPLPWPAALGAASRWPRPFGRWVRPPPSAVLGAQG